MGRLEDRQKELAEAADRGWKISPPTDPVADADQRAELHAQDQESDSGDRPA